LYCDVEKIDAFYSDMDSVESRWKLGYIQELASVHGDLEQKREFYKRFWASDLKMIPFA